MQNVIHVTRKVTYPHAAKMSKISVPKETNRKAKAHEKANAKAKERVKVIAEQIRLIGVKPIRSVNCVKSITNTSNRARLRIRLNQKSRMKWQKQ